jgi:hypothetical protein
MLGLNLQFILAIEGTSGNFLITKEVCGCKGDLNWELRTEVNGQTSVDIDDNLDRVSKKNQLT